MIPWLTLLLLCLSGTAALAQTQDLYSGEVQVADESPGARNGALAEAMQQVLVRVSGRSDIMSDQGARAVLAKASALVQQFRYRSVPAPGDADQPAQKYLSARFDPAAVRRAMSQQGLPVWEGRRPRVLMWVAAEQGASRRLLNIADDAATREALDRRAAARGMPLQLPLLDLEDQSAITAADVWAGYASAIREASSRYPHDAILTGRLRKQPGGRWSADWTLWQDDRSQLFGTGGADQAQALVAGIDVAQDRLAARPVAQAGAQGAVRVSVSGVSGLGAYAHLLQRLGASPGIEGVHLLGVDKDRLLLGVNSAGGSEAVSLALRGMPDLRALPAPLAPLPETGGEEDGAQTGPDADLYFDLVGALE